MCNRKYFTVGAFCLLVFGHGLFAQIVLEGVVTDSGSEPVENALVELIDMADANRTFSDYTDALGRYTIEIVDTYVDGIHTFNPNDFHLFQNYPNPFNPSTVIAFELPRPADIRIDIYNVLGQRIRTLFDGLHSERKGRIVWDGMDDSGRGVPAGIYIYTLNANGIRIHKKMLLLDGHGGDSHSPPSQPEGGDGRHQTVVSKKVSNQYLFRITGDDILTYERTNLEITANTVLDVTVVRAGTVTDIDGNTYQTVKIGDQWWMAKNLKVTRYRNGDPIPNVTDDGTWAGLTTGACCTYDNDDTYVETYGRLYNWFAVDDSRNIAPEGWHVPSDEEWKELEMTLGMSRSEADAADWRGTDEGGKLKETGTTHWNAPNVGATNESGFSALPGGLRTLNGIYNNIWHYAFFWSSTELTSSNAWFRYLINSNAQVYRYSDYKHDGFSVRCVKDADAPGILTGIAVTPMSKILDNGETQQFCCTATYSDQSTQDVTAQASWSVSPADAGSIDANGLFTAHASNTGFGTITATYQGQTAQATVQVFQIGTMTDIDGNTYRTVQIGSQCWMMENLKVTHYRNGDPIPNVTDDTDWSNLTTGGYCHYDNDANNADVYGSLYNWFAVNDSRNIAPEGWHVPTDEEWKTLEMFLGMSQAQADGEGWRGTDQGGKLKEAGTMHWNAPNTGATNESGFTALPGGLRNCSGGFDSMGFHTGFWTYTETTGTAAWERYMNHDRSVIHRTYEDKHGGFSVRCVRD